MCMCGCLLNYGDSALNSQSSCLRLPATGLCHCISYFSYFETRTRKAHSLRVQAIIAEKAWWQGCGVQSIMAEKAEW